MKRQKGRKEKEVKDKIKGNESKETNEEEVKVDEETEQHVLFDNDHTNRIKKTLVRD